MAPPHPSASAPGPLPRPDASGLMHAEYDDDALGFESAVPCLQIESWAAEQAAAASAGNAESASRLI